MNDAPVNTRSIKTYSDQKISRHLMYLGFALIATGILLTTLPGISHRQWLFSIAIALAGVLWCLVCHFRLFNPGKPLLELSPRGLTLRNIGEVFIPWHEVHGIESIDRTIWPALYAPAKVTFRDLTVVLISRDFYNEHIAPKASLLSARAWSNTFISKGDNLIQVGIHHDILPASPAELRREIAARWYAFRDGGNDRTSASGSSGSTRPDDPAKAPGKPDKQVKFRIRWDKP